MALTEPLTRTTDSRETAFHGCKNRLGHFLLGDGHLDDPGPVADEHEGEAAKVPDLVDPAGRSPRTAGLPV